MRHTVSKFFGYSELEGNEEADGSSNEALLQHVPEGSDVDGIQKQVHCPVSRSCMNGPPIAVPSVITHCTSGTALYVWGIVQLQGLHVGISMLSHRHRTYFLSCRKRSHRVTATAWTRTGRHIRLM